jgi:hypothetical protein
MALAGLWENWRSSAREWVRSFAIITTTPNELCAELHNRLPVVLGPRTWPAWLGGSLPMLASSRRCSRPTLLRKWYVGRLALRWATSKTTTPAWSSRSRRNEPNRRLAAHFVICARQIHPGGDRARSSAACYFLAGHLRGMSTRDGLVSVLAIGRPRCRLALPLRGGWRTQSVLSDGAYAPNSSRSRGRDPAARIDPLQPFASVDGDDR